MKVKNKISKRKLKRKHLNERKRGKKVRKRRRDGANSKAKGGREKPST